MRFDLTGLSLDDLVALKKYHENEIDLCRTERAALLAKCMRLERKLRIGGIKLSLGGVSLVGGVVLSPVTFGWSLLPGLVSGGVFAWDARDLGVLAGELRATQREIESWKTRVTVAEEEIQSINAELGRRPFSGRSIV